MLARITGTLEEIEQTTALITVSGADGCAMGYAVLLPAVVADELTPRLGETVTLHTVHYLEQQSQGSSFLPRIVGFATTDQRRFFELFTTVKGLGPRRALRALRVPFEHVARAICERDNKFLQTLPEIGKRLAETIIAELHGKADDFASPAEPGSTVEPKPDAGALTDGARQAVAALVHLGEGRNEAEDLVRRVIAEGADAGTADEILAAAFALRS
ncbi:MAG: Holliday junction branch migration protein RuvA [Planctomycetota bacterium]